MAATIDSKAAFLAKLRDLELDGLYQKFLERGWGTYGDFAFACTAPPGFENNKFEDDMVKHLLGNEDRKLEARVRRLFAISFAIAAHEVEAFTMQRSSRGRDSHE